MVDELIGHQTLEGGFVTLVSRSIDGVKRLPHSFSADPEVVPGTCADAVTAAVVRSSPKNAFVGVLTK